MVLGADRQGAGRTRTLPLVPQRGSAAVEFALALPFVVLAVVLVAHAALLGADLLAAHSVATQAARIAAVEPDTVVTTTAREAAGRRDVTVTLEPPSPHRRRGDVVAASVRLRTKAFAVFGAEVWLPARASTRVERP